MHRDCSFGDDVEWLLLLVLGMPVVLLLLWLLLSLLLRDVMAATCNVQGAQVSAIALGWC
jgi:hypothetical protein